MCIKLYSYVNFKKSPTIGLKHMPINCLKNHWVECVYLCTFRTRFCKKQIQTIKNRLKQIRLTYLGMC